MMSRLHGWNFKWILWAMTEKSPQSRSRLTCPRTFWVPLREKSVYFIPRHMQTSIFVPFYCPPSIQEWVRSNVSSFTYADEFEGIKLEKWPFFGLRGHVQIIRLAWSRLKSPHFEFFENVSDYYFFFAEEKRIKKAIRTYFTTEEKIIHANYASNMGSFSTPINNKHLI